MKLDTEFEGATAAIAFVDREIAKRATRCLKRLGPAAELLADLETSRRYVTKSEAVIEDMGPAFNKGIKQVVDDVYSYFSGYSSNGEDIVMGEAMTKASESLPLAIAAFAEQFPVAANMGVDAAGDTSALAILRPLGVALKTALAKSINWEFTGGTTPTISKDPFQSDKTLENDSIMAIAAQNSGPSAVLKSDSLLAVSLAKAAETVAKNAEEKAVEWPMDLTSWSKKRR